MLSRSSLHPFSGLDVAWLVETRAATRREHPFLVWEPFEGAGETISYGDFHARVTLEKVAKAELRRRLEAEAQP
jgi:carnitine-CoA ligase